jgi:GDPmannose 4,6-dehydratase
LPVTIWVMMQREEPEDFVIATGEMHSVRDAAELAFAHDGLHWEQFVVVDQQPVRPTEVDQLRGDAAKAKELSDASRTCHSRP